MVGIEVHYKPENRFQVFTSEGDKVGSDASDLVNWMKFPKLQVLRCIFGELLILNQMVDFEKTIKIRNTFVTDLLGIRW